MTSGTANDFLGRRWDSEGEAMNGYSIVSEPTVDMPLFDQPRWYAIQTRARHEKRVAAELEYTGIAHFLPILKETHCWSDRRKVVEVPLFPCYTFVNLIPEPGNRFAVLRIPGVLNFVGVRNFGLPIPDSQIEDVQLLLKQQIPMAPYSFLKIGQRVRIRGGALDGMEGHLVGKNGNSRLVISIDAIERSLTINVQGYDLEPL
jgi:transcription antitermination factor NusG